MTQIVTRLFDNFADAEHAVIELERAGVPHGEISLVSHESNHEHARAHVREPLHHTASDAAVRDAGVGAALGGVLGAGGGAMVGLGLLAVPGLGPVVAAGWLATAALGALVGGAVVAGAGGIVGALTHAGVSREEAEVYAEGVRRGGTLVSVQAKDDKVALVRYVLDSMPSVDIANRRAAWVQDGWSGYDADAAPYTREEVDRERARWIVPG